MPKTGDVYGVLSQGETGGLVVGGGACGTAGRPKNLVPRTGERPVVLVDSESVRMLGVNRPLGFGARVRPFEGGFEQYTHGGLREALKRMKRLT